MDKLSDDFQEIILNEQIGQIEENSTEISVEYLNEAFSAITEKNGVLDLSDTVAKELPVVKTLYSAVKIWSGVKNYFLAQKIYSFLFELKSIPRSEREVFLNRLDTNGRNEILFQLANILENHDRLNKSSIQGRLFKGLILEGLTQSEYFSLTQAVNSLDLETIKILEDFYVSNTIPGSSEEDLFSLISHRLLRVDNSKVSSWDAIGVAYRKNKLGILLVTIGLKKLIPIEYIEEAMSKDEVELFYKKLKLINEPLK